MKLHLLRHGIAVNRDPSYCPDDSTRPLSSRGEKQVNDIAKAMRRMRLDFDTIWCSPFVRTRQTATAVAEELALLDRLHAREELAPGGDTGKLLAALEELEPRPASVLLVGHEPYLSGLLSVMTSGGPNLRAQIKKGGLAKLEVSRPLGLHACAALQWLVPPRLLVEISQ